MGTGDNLAQSEDLALAGGSDEQPQKKTKKRKAPMKKRMAPMKKRMATSDDDISSISAPVAKNNKKKKL